MYMWTWITSLSLLTGVALGSSLADVCGKGDILKQSTIRAGDKDITVITTNCPNLGAPQSTMSNLVAGDAVEKCDKSPDACAISCDSTAAQPQQVDCDALAVGLNRLDYDSFTLQPLTSMKYMYKSCAFSYLNYDNASAYEPCIVQFSMQALATTVNCRGSQTPTLTGKCVAPGGADNTWTIE